MVRGSRVVRGRARTIWILPGRELRCQPYCIVTAQSGSEEEMMTTAVCLQLKRMIRKRYRRVRVRRVGAGCGDVHELSQGTLNPTSRLLCMT